MAPCGFVVTATRLGGGMKWGIQAKSHLRRMHRVSCPFLSTRYLLLLSRLTPCKRVIVYSRRVHQLIPSAWLTTSGATEMLRNRSFQRLVRRRLLIGFYCQGGAPWLRLDPIVILTPRQYVRCVSSMLCCINNTCDSVAAGSPCALVSVFPSGSVLR